MRKSSMTRQVEAGLASARPVRYGGSAALVALLVLLLTACGSYPVSKATGRSTSGRVGDLVVSDFRVLPPPGGAYSAGGVAIADLAVVNNGAQWDQLIAATSPASTAVQILRFGGQQAQAVFKGGGQRTEGVLLQLTGLRKSVRAGGNLTITLTFRHAGELTSDVPVQRPQATPASSSG
jgi:copper(I)-binding protein